MQEDAAIETFEARLVHEQDDDEQVNDDGEPCGFAPARAGEVVLQVKQKSGDGIFVEVTIGSFPMARVVEAGRLLSGRRGVAPWSCGVIDIVRRSAFRHEAGNPSCARKDSGRRAEASFLYSRTFPRKPLKLRGRKTYAHPP